MHWEKSAGEANTGKTMDISAGGIRLILREGIKIGDILEVDMELGGDRSIHAKGRVAWVDKFKPGGWHEETGYEGGVEFIDMNEATRKELARFVMQSHKGTS